MAVLRTTSAPRPSTKSAFLTITTRIVFSMILSSCCRRLPLMSGSGNPRANRQVLRDELYDVMRPLRRQKVRAAETDGAKAPAPVLDLQDRRRRRLLLLRRRRRLARRAAVGRRAGSRARRRGLHRVR